VWVLESREADGLRVLQSNPDWMAARVRGVTGYQAKHQPTSAGEDGTGQPATHPELDSEGSDKSQTDSEGFPR
jgi:hypothetical protein